MTAQVQPIDSRQHRLHGWKRYDNYRFAAEDAYAPLIIAELTAVLSIYPIAFASRPDGGYQPVVLLGLYAGENLFVNDSGRWPGYVPCHYRRYPFSLKDIKLENDTHSAALCFNHASGLYRETPTAKGEERFFNDEGQPGPLVQHLLAFLGKTAASLLTTFRAADALQSADLLEPWELPLKNPDAGRPLLQGLYGIRESALADLSGEALKTLQTTNALALAYAHLFSIQRLSVLHRLSEQRVSKVAPQPLESLDALWEAQDDMIRF
jgi:hypothetical protein